MEERVEERERMVRQQIASGVGGRTPVTDEATLRAMREVPRHAFIPARMRPRAYEDTPLPIGEGQTISQPYIVAYMTQLLGIDETSRVLEIGTGSGYQAAVLAHITPHVWTIEIVEPLAERARRDFAAQGYDGIEVRTGDGYLGWPEAAPFDAIIVTAAAPELPQPLWEQLAPGGRIVMPRGPHGGVQELVVIHKGEDGEQREESLFPVRFVPFTRAPELEE
ncbi:MAG: protein-L-isoaspartate(D-aspartate) O-methyltransferase [Deltaproteobacteria bacterium]|nr:MAG: protein-L-isoaspartate(D-aspartate) O-methyltransferase [Deltaproteobacteria bacterium]